MALSSAQLAAFQSAVNGLMDQSITIKRATRTADGTGHYADTWNTIATVNGSLSQPTGGIMQNYDYLVAGLDSWLASLPVGTNVHENDRLVTSTQTVRVQLLLQPESYQVCILAICAALEGGPA